MFSLCKCVWRGNQMNFCVHVIWEYTAVDQANGQLFGIDWNLNSQDGPSLRYIKVTFVLHESILTRLLTTLVLIEWDFCQVKLQIVVVEFFLQCHRCHFFSWLERMLYVQLVTCWKCPALVDLTHCITHEVNPLLRSVETKKLTHLVYQLRMSSLLVISKNYILSPFLDFHQLFVSGIVVCS
jgi:hypothetical protein